MTLLLLGLGLGLLTIPALVRPLARRLPPSEWAKACAGLLAVGWMAMEASLLLQAAPTLLRTVGLERLAELCEHALGPVAPGGPVLGVVAGGVATAVALLAARSLLAAHHRQQTVRVEPGIGWHAQVGGHELVVLPSGDPVAFSTAGRPGQLVLSHGLIAALSGAELAAVLRHELAHLHHRHQRYLQLARTVERSLGLLPGVRGATGALRCALERWADEEAAGSNATSRANVHAALLRLAELAATPGVAAFTTPGTVAERLAALRADPTGGRAVGRRAAVYGPAGLLLGAATATLVAILAQVPVLHALAGLCPPH
jgi:Zn-dependent protease with chaperone function